MNHLESKIQAAIVQYLQILGFFAFSCPNELAGGGKNAARRMQYFISCGLRSGVSDLIVWIGKYTIYMEVKTPTGRQSESQKRFQARCEKEGRIYRIVRSVEDVERIIKEFEK